MFFSDSNTPEDQSFWSKSPRSDSPSPDGGSVGYGGDITSPPYSSHEHFSVYSPVNFGHSDVYQNHSFKSK